MSGLTVLVLITLALVWLKGFYVHLDMYKGKYGEVMLTDTVLCLIWPIQVMFYFVYIVYCGLLQITPKSYIDF